MLHQILFVYLYVTIHNNIAIWVHVDCLYTST